jgi:O-antigen/teichoic acid export membrane protein
MVNKLMKIKLQLRKLIEKGFFHIFGANVINKIIGFASGIFLVRLLSKEEFGLFSYAQNLLSVFLLLNSLGVTAGMLQFASESSNTIEKNSFFKFGIKVGFLYNLLVCFVIIFMGIFVPFQFEGVSTLIIIMFALPLLIFFYETLKIYFRANLENKKFSYLTTLNTFLVFILSISGAYFYQAFGVIAFRYFAYFVTLIFGIFLIRKSLSGIVRAKKLLKEKKKDFMKFSLTQSFNNSISQLLYVMDIFIIGIILADELIIASYKTATFIPFALNFIPSSIMVFIYPYFAKKRKDKKWIKTKYKKLTKYLFIFNLIITLFLIIFSEFIINIIFGPEYLDSIAPFIILSVGYLIAGTFRIPIGNILVMMKKVKFGLFLSIITGLLNIILNVILISNFGSIGAAVSTVIVFVFTSVLGFWYLQRSLRT